VYEQAQRVLPATYSDGRRHLHAEEWLQAFLCFQKIQQLEPGYRDTEWLLSRVQRELTRQMHRRTQLLGQEGANLAQQTEEQVVQSARDFYGYSLGRLKSQLQGDRYELESLVEQVPQWERRGQIEEMTSNYAAVEDSINRVAQIVGVQDTVEDQDTNQSPQGSGGTHLRKCRNRF
jgi:hypothetical protein